MYYVADTHAFLWYLTNDPRLGRKATRVFESADTGEISIIIPAIVLLECIDILDKKKVVFDFEAILSKIVHADNFILSAIDWGLILETNRTKGLKDLHDRVIIATAVLFDAGLISKDRVIKQYYHKTLW